MIKNMKLFLSAGALLGGSLGVAVFFLMDYLFRDSLGGSWKDAIVNDLHLLLSIEVNPNSPFVYLTYAFIIGIVVLFGALIGALFSIVYYRFFRMLNR